MPTILLALLNEDQATAATSIEAALARLEGKVDAQTVARALAQTIAGIPRFCILQSALSTVLEQNISEEGIAQYKQGVLRVGLRLGNAMRAALSAYRTPRAAAVTRSMAPPNRAARR